MRRAWLRAHEASECDISSSDYLEGSVILPVERELGIYLRWVRPAVFAQPI